MKELRSAVNAVFLFAVFLLLYAAMSPGHARGSSHPPRFLRMEMNDLRHHHGRKVTVTVPYFFIGNALRFAALGRLHRELDVHWNEDIDSEDLRKLWDDLKAANEGQEVVREKDNAVTKFKKEGESILLDCAKKDGFGEHVKVRIPVRLMEAAVRDGRDFDVNAVISELRKAHVGDLVEVDSDDAHVKVWIE
ncbi:MAG TPA: hypothetical protein VKF32_09180 [Thermoanaerobaculia bacterium]|nr:hypothetical protein [Thermoanaerobaculia bacterium]